MNPYLESPDVWATFHARMIAEMSDRLSDQLRPNYLVHIETHLWIHDVADDEDGTGRRRLIGRTDAAVSDRDQAEEQQTGSGTMTAVLAPPVRITLAQVDIERQRYIEIRDRRNRQLVTIVELLSPSNKAPGDDWEQYQTKRTEALKSLAHLVEIDLLRGGRPMPERDRPKSSYGVMVSRVEERPTAGFWPIALRDRPPTIPVPLRENAYATLDLQAMLHRVYDHGTYAEEIYESDPVPALEAADLAWARQIAASSTAQAR
jgi:hypothetical protein